MTIDTYLARAVRYWSDDRLDAELRAAEIEAQDWDEESLDWLRLLNWERCRRDGYFGGE